MFSKKFSKIEVVIGAETIIRGEISSKGTVKIDGRLEGDITADCVIIGDSGSVVGDVAAKTFIAGGKLQGNVRSSESVEILSSGEINGDIATPRLSVAEGAIFDGHSMMQKSNNIEYKPVEVLQ